MGIILTFRWWQHAGSQKLVIYAKRVFFVKTGAVYEHITHISNHIYVNKRNMISLYLLNNIHHDHYAFISWEYRYKSISAMLSYWVEKFRTGGGAGGAPITPCSRLTSRASDGRGKQTPQVCCVLSSNFKTNYTAHSPSNGTDVIYCLLSPLREETNEDING